MHSTTHKTLIRLERALRDRVEPFIYSDVSPLQVEAWVVGGEPVDPHFALGILAGGEGPSYSPFEVGDPWGAPWDTTWFRFSGVAPAGSSLQVVIDLGWADHSVGFQCEGLVYRPDGTIVKALNPKSRWISLADLASPGEPFVFYVEAASNPLLLGVPAFQPIDHGTRPKSYEGTLYTLRRAQICEYHESVAELALDLEVLSGLAATLPKNTARRERILMSIDRALNLLDPVDIDATAALGREELSSVLSKPANASAQRISAMGHAHIDSAWLWPTRETERKVARTVANVLELLEDHDDFVFTMSSAQQFVWLENRYPQLFARLSEQVSKGRVIPVGGMWVEPDGMLPSGESYARQALLGQHYFKSRFGRYCELMWLPDSFGYSGSLPQLATLGGMDRFLTQKISWNDTNSFPHHSFWWEGIDGTRVLTHFPPADTYGAAVTAEELDRSAHNYRDKGISDNSILLYGYGDGGGGPTREMIARAARFANLEDAPRVEQRGPREFFDDLYEELKGADSCWTGELYLELHRGTFTSQSDTKLGNRRNEALIRQVEAASTRAALEGHPYPHRELERAWEELLLGQFHDILPGTSINWVYDDATSMHRSVEESLLGLLEDADAALGFSSAPHAAPDTDSVRLEENEGRYLLSNDLLEVRVDSASGLVTSVVDRDSGRELVAEGHCLGELAIYQDEPVMWDAWDIERTARDTKRVIADVSGVHAFVDHEGAHVSVSRSFGESHATVTYSLSDDNQLHVGLDIDWNENEKLLKLLFPIRIHANSALFETQFGQVERQIHENTSWDAARFEVCAHRYLYVGEPSFGVGLINDSCYGYSVGRPSGHAVEIGASVLKSANFPDREADRGRHTKNWALVVTSDVSEVIDAAERLNDPVPSHMDLVATVSDPLNSARLSAAKMAQDGSGDVIVRIYESLGDHTRARIELPEVLKDSKVTTVDFLEDYRPEEGVEMRGTHIEAELRPYQVLSLRITPLVRA